MTMPRVWMTWMTWMTWMSRDRAGASARSWARASVRAWAFTGAFAGAWACGAALAAPSADPSPLQDPPRAMPLAASGAAAMPAADAAPPRLPGDEAVRPLLQQLPAVRQASAQREAARARGDRLRVGSAEWTARVGLDRRSEQAGARFTEAEIGVERPWRASSKREADGALAGSEQRLGQLLVADAWHEAARGLLRDWFDALRDAHAARLLQAQAELVAQELSVVRRRVSAGEAARLELLDAEAELSRVQGQAARAQSQARVRRLAFERLYPGLPAPEATGRLPEWGDEAIEPQRAYAAILDDNHELELAEARAARADQHARRVALERRADPTVGVRATRERGGQEHVLGVVVSIPLGGAGREADARAALAEADAAREDVALVRQRVETQALQTALEVGATQAARRALREAQARADQSAALQSRAYALGEGALADLLRARRNALEARQAADAAAIDEWQARERLRVDSHQLWASPEPH